MSEKPKRRPSSDGHPAVTAYRSKLESIQDTTLPALDEALERLEKATESTKPPQHVEAPCDDP